MSFYLDKNANTDSTHTIASVRDSGSPDILTYVCKSQESGDKHKNYLELNLNSKKCFFFPNVGGRQVIFVAGRSGSGKSTFIRNYAVAYQDYYDRPCYIFSSKDSDPSLDKFYGQSYGMLEGKLKLFQIDITEDNIEEFTSEKILGEFTKSLVIFDDVLMSDRKMEKQVDRLLTLMMKLGRQAEISVIVSRHELQDTRNKQVKEEAHMVICFPAHSFKKHIINFCTQIGVSVEGTKKILASQDRWVGIKTQAPLFAISTSQIFDIS